MLKVGEEILLFLKAIFGRWWALMSCALWTFTAIYGEALNKGNLWYIHASFWLAVLVVFVAAFLGWREQYELVEAQNRCISGYESKAFDLSFISSMAWEGNVLAGTAPSENADEKEVDEWKYKVKRWVGDTREKLFALSPVAANKFGHARKSSEEPCYGVSLSVHGDLSLLNERLDNLTDIMEKAHVYVIRIQDRP